MDKKFPSFALLLLIVLLAGCASATTPPPTSTLAATATASTPAASPTPLVQTATATTAAPTAPAATATTAAAATAAPTATGQPAAIQTNTPAAGSSGSTGSSGSSGSNGSSGSTATLGDYLDDRSTPSGLVLSLFNAINRKEYARAYAYWQNPAANPNVGSFAQFQQGYQDTAAVQVTLGTINSGVGAGQIYYTVPVVLKAQTTGGQTRTFAGCYTTHLSSPAVQTTPPYLPMALQSAEVKPADNAADPATLLGAACPPASGTLNPVPTTDANNIAAANYLDDRSSAVSVLRSLFNAVNRKEYARAYTYWLTPTQPFDAFQQGYQSTAAVEATFGAPTSDVGAGQIRFRVPVQLKAQTTDGKTQFFAGCYQLHLSQPANQTVPPYQPLGIEKAQMVQAASAAAASQLADACAGMQ